MTGTETVTLNITQMPAHVHNGPFSFTPRACDTGEDSTPVANFAGPANNGYATTSTAGTTVAGPKIISQTIGTSGSSQPFEILTPYLTLNYVICISGLFPSRN
jgi:microcystin-dependent protein